MIEQEIESGRLRALTEEEARFEQRGTFPGFALMNYLTELARHKKLVSIFTGAGMVLGVIYALVLPTLFTATTRIMTPRQTQSSASLLMSQLAGSSSGSLALAAAGGGFALRNPNDVYIGLLTSRPVQDAIIRRFGLMNVYRAKDLTAARNLLAENTSLASEKSSLIAISFTDRDRRRAADVANAYTEELSVLTKNLALTESSHRRMFYEEQLKTATKDLAGAQLAFAQVEQTRGIIQPEAQAKAVVSGIADLQAQATAKQIQLEALRSFSTERNPEVQLAEKEQDALRGEIAQAEQRTPQPDSAALGMKGVASAGLEFLRVEHEVQYRQMLLDLLVRQFDAAKLDESNDAAVIAVVEQAIPPERKSSPHRATIAMGFLFFGFLGGCSFVLASSFLRRNREISQSLETLMSEFASK